MKNLIIAIVIFLLPAFSFAQEHSTIEKLEVNYKIAPIDSSSLVTLKVNAFMEITLKNATDLSKIHLKVKNIFSLELVYKVDYNNTVEPILNEDGFVLFKKTGETISIGCPDKWLLSSYLYEIITEDTNTISSETFTQIQ